MSNLFHQLFRWYNEVINYFNSLAIDEKFAVGIGAIMLAIIIVGSIDHFTNGRM